MQQMLLMMTYCSSDFYEGSHKCSALEIFGVNKKNGNNANDLGPGANNDV